MAHKSVILTFPKDLANKPVVTELVRNYDIEVNILQARIQPNSAGHMFAILKGSAVNLDGAIDYLKNLEVNVVLPAKNLVWDEEQCVACGACVSRCISGAFTVEPDTRKVVFDESKCIACELCVPACSYGAVESISDHLRRERASS